MHAECENTMKAQDLTSEESANVEKPKSFCKTGVAKCTKLATVGFV